MPIDLSNLSAEDITATTAAVEAARKAREEQERREAEERQRQQEEEQVHQVVTMRREAEARKAEAERRDRLAQEKVAWEAAAAEDMETIALDKIGLIRRAWSPLFLPLDGNMEPSDESYVDEAEGSGSEEGSKDEDENVEEDEDEGGANKMNVDQTLRD
jgi:hypothetical protein